MAEIWLPKGEIKVIITNGDVYVREEIVMRPGSVAKKQPGFNGDSTEDEQGGESS